MNRLHPVASEPAPSAEALYAQRMLEIHCRGDRLFFWLLLAQWAFAIVLAVVLSPYAWEGLTRSVHLHVQIAVLLGGLINSLPLLLIWRRPGWSGTRQAVAVAQVLWSGLLIHLTGGRIETHFHVFGSLAFLAFYLDWRVLLSATLVVVADHFLRGLYWPESVYGTLNPAWWRFLEHGGWVLFEDVILVQLCLQSQTWIRALSEREAGLEKARRGVEQQVRERTEQLSAAKDLYRTLLENTSAVPWELDPQDCSCLYVGPQVERLWGWTIQEFARPGFMLDCTLEEDRETLRAALRGIAPGDETTLEYRLKKSDGVYAWVRSYIGGPAPQSPWSAVRGVSIDITHQKTLELELRQAQKLESVGRLAAGVAHEINTPVQFVNDSCHFVRDGLAELQTLLGHYRQALQELAEGQGSAAEAQQRIRQQEQAADIDYLLENMPGAIDRSLEGLQRVATIVRSMKEFAHPDQKEKAYADINQAILSTLTIARTEYKYVADVVTELGEIPPVHCFLGDLNQALLNIVVNAAHAIEEQVRGTDRRGRIAIRTWQQGPDVMISIEDTGGGIAESIRERIFDPFFTTKDVGKGTGQGLAIARSVVVDKHQGELRFDTRVGHGTTFYIRLPIHHADSAPQRAAA